MRLPTEWEWQAVADFNGIYNYGCGKTINQSKANYYLGSGNYCNPLGLSNIPYTSPVGYYPAYGYGMCDMAGNIWEWTSTGSSGYHILRSGPEEALNLARAIRDVKEKVRHCSVCFNMAETDPCHICTDAARFATAAVRHSRAPAGGGFRAGGSLHRLPSRGSHRSGSAHTGSGYVLLYLRSSEPRRPVSEHRPIHRNARIGTPANGMVRYRDLYVLGR